MNRIVFLKDPVNLARRCISTTSVVAGKRNFRKFYIPSEVRGTRSFREKQKTNPDPRIPLETYGVRKTTITDENGDVVEIPEMIPELIVPDLKDFELKPYVSYRSADFQQSEFTAEDLFNAVYSSKIVEDWNKKQLNENGSPKSPSQDELLEPEEAFLRARKTGSDVFGEEPDDTQLIA